MSRGIIHEQKNKVSVEDNSSGWERRIYLNPADYHLTPSEWNKLSQLQKEQLYFNKKNTIGEHFNNG